MLERLGEIARLHPGARLVWCQEESQNMGAWSWICPQLASVFGKQSRSTRAATPRRRPAVGSLAIHRRELAGLFEDAFTL
jgi:2-oxoglutarate dehydrogenase E1 component